RQDEEVRQMARPQRSSEVRRTLDDFLNPRQRGYLDEEPRVLGDAGFPLWHLSQSPYPLDAETAAAVGGIMDDFVLPWCLVELRVEEWAYPGFHQNALAYRAGLSECGLDVPPGALPGGPPGVQWDRRGPRIPATRGLAGRVRGRVSGFVPGDPRRTVA